jgi:hypothetical protein
MANALYTVGKQNLLDAGIDLNTNVISVVGVDHGTDTPVPSTDEDLADIGAGARVRTTQNGDTGIDSSGGLTSPVITGGVFDAADYTWLAVTGNSIESLNGYKNTGVAGTSFLIWYMDTTSNSSLPVTPNGGDISVVWSSGGSKIFAL